MKRLLIFFLLFAPLAEAGPKYWIAHHKRFLLMEGGAVGSAIVLAKGVDRCRSTGVEKCVGQYGAAWGIVGFTIGANFAMTAAAEGCWKNDGGKFCNVLAYGGSAGQLGFGIAQWRKENHAETNLFALTRR